MLERSKDNKKGVVTIVTLTFNGEYIYYLLLVSSHFTN